MAQFFNRRYPPDIFEIDRVPCRTGKAIPGIQGNRGCIFSKNTPYPVDFFRKNTFSENEK